jgi:hypothetical protein
MTPVKKGLKETVEEECPPASTERVRRHRNRTHRKKEFFRIVAQMTGENSRTGKYTKNASSLVCVNVYKKKQWASRVSSGSMETGELSGVKSLRNLKIDYECTSRGYIGVSPPTLVVNLFRELKTGSNGNSLEAGLQWKNIQIREGLGEKKGGQGQYYMFHWGNKKNAEEKNVQDWKEEDNLFSKFLKGQVDDFAFSITRRFLASDTGENLETRERFFEYYSVLPGLVNTKKPYNQAAHTDMDTWGLIVHMPLSKEGMMLMIWDANRLGGSRVGTKGEHHYIPFGCFFVLPAYVTHSGVYGNKGNCRFHMVVRRRKDKWERDTIKSGVERDNPENRPPWKGVFGTMKKGASGFSDLYLDYLVENLGSTFCKEWIDE